MRWVFFCLATVLAVPTPATAGSLAEPPHFAEAVAAGQLPPLKDRLPDPPLVVEMDGGRTIGRYGGTLNILMARSKDVRQMVVYGYARLVRYGRDYEIAPDILKDVEIEDGRIFTLYLRPGHHWSDGAPFTTEDFRYWWEDVANNPALNPSGPRNELRIDGELPAVEIIDKTTIRFSWSRPNPKFLPALAAASPLYIYRPAHYLKQFHARYTDEAVLNGLARERGQHNWAALHNMVDNLYKNDNTDLPSLQPWVSATRMPADRFTFVRNPYFHRVDAEGRQLPYIDQVVMQIASARIIPAKTGTGESDLQARYLRFDNYTFLKQNEQRNGFRTLLWRSGKGSHMTLYPNLNVRDPVWRALLRDVRFRRALSLAIDRHEVNQVIYYGLALASQNTVLPQSPLFREDYRRAWTQFDLDKANRLLDDVGLTGRNSAGVRLLPDGRAAEIIIETAGESTEQTDILSLVRDSWQKVGIRLYSRPSQRDVLRNRIYSGETLMSIWEGLENGLPTADTIPEEFAPSHQIQYQWPMWGQYVETGGRSGEPVDMDEPQQLFALLDQWYEAGNRARREEIWHRMLAIWTDQLFTIGIVSGAMQPVVVNARLRNIPEDGMYTWDPGAHFGIYGPDTFWLDT
ncbi:MAG: ABC transporter substrate-binding protein [Alphaproteobacteria bacterium]|nr:ABC transporter substrate-binding protein [Alphaproteobacteria bacterium]